MLYWRILSLKLRNPPKSNSQFILWMISAHGDFMQQGNLNHLNWMITTYVPVHKCNFNILNHDHWEASSTIIGEFDKSNFIGVGCVYILRDINEDVYNELRANLSYEKAWRVIEYGTPSMEDAKWILWKDANLVFCIGMYQSLLSD